MAPLDDPSSGAVSRKHLLLSPLLSSAANVRCVSISSHQLPHFGKVIPFVQTQVLKLPRLGHWPIYHHALKRGLEQFHVVAIGSVHGHTYRDTTPFSQETAFGPLLASVCRIWPSTLTPQAEPWSWLHPLLATPNLSRVVCRIQPTHTAIEPRRLQRPAKVGTDRAQCWAPRSSEVEPSIGSRYASCRRSHPYTGGQVSKACRLSDGDAPQVTAAQCAPTRHRDPPILVYIR